PEQCKRSQLPGRARFRFQLERPRKPAQAFLDTAVFDEGGHVGFDSARAGRCKRCRGPVMGKGLTQPSLVPEGRAQVGMSVGRFRSDGYHLAQESLGLSEASDVDQQRCQIAFSEQMVGCVVDACTVLTLRVREAMQFLKHAAEVVTRIEVPRIDL